MDTYFAPARRTERRKFKNQIFDISHSPIMDALLKTMAGLMVVLNEDRQIVALNYAFLNAIGMKDAEDVLGLRFGESMGCIHAAEEPAGCGTTPYCSSCGAAIALMAAIEGDKPEERLCTLTTEKEGATDDICLLVRAQPISLDENRWILVFAQDITQQQFWTNMERVFFHDISNMVTALVGNSHLLAMEMPESSSAGRINEVAMRLSSEIKIQRSLLQYKDAKYLLRKTTASLGDIRKELALIVEGHESYDGKEIDENWPDEDIGIYTDTYLVSKILGNMVINALEATGKGGVIKIRTAVESGYIKWDVWNEGFIPEEVGKRIFQKYFSKKSNMGRGLGTYSMKLFGERYLKGKVFFTSLKTKGTTFSFHLPR